MTKLIRAGMAGAVAAVALSASASAQTLAARVAAAPDDGTIHFSFAAKPGVCGDGERISVHGAGERILTREATVRTRSGRDGMRDCVEGPVDVELVLERGAIAGTRVSVGGQRERPATALGAVAPADAAAFLLSPDVLRNANGRAAGRLVFAATLADAEVWPQLLAAARDASLPEPARRDAIFWLGQEAGERAAEGLTSLIGDAGDELDVRKHAVFALSQIRGDASVEALIQVARTSREPEIRRTAIFWLGQSNDPRALAFFEEVLRG